MSGWPAVELSLGLVERCPAVAMACSGGPWIYTSVLALCNADGPA